MPSPFAPASFPDLPAFDGVTIGATAAGVRTSPGDDVTVFSLPPGTRAAGVFTRSRVRAAPVRWCHANLAYSEARALVVNAGVANAATGPDGLRATEAVATAAAALLGCDPRAVMVCSTGVIGKPLPVARITGGLPAALAAARPDGWARAARAIMTTDTYPKGAAATAEVGGKTVHIAGIAKGAGMICPDMATMLSFLVTDADLPGATLQALLAEATFDSFNAVTVDGDTSTNDTVLLFATGRAGNAPDADLAGFRAALAAVTLALALQIVSDGEGLSRLLRVRVTGALDRGSARQVARTIANSPLVKTAVAGGDPNWGRIAAAAGRAGVEFEEEGLSILLGGHAALVRGVPVADLDQKALEDVFSADEVVVTVDLGVGEARDEVITCDLTAEYIHINADYHT